MRLEHNTARIFNTLLTCSLLCLTCILHGQTPPHPKLVGYFPQWGLYNDGHPYLVKDLVTSGSARLLDQINYAQGFVTNGRCSIADPNADLNHAFTARESVTQRADSVHRPFRGYLHQLAELKKKYPRLKLLISLEGRGSDFSFDARPENRAAFISSCIDIFLKGNLAPGIHAPRLFDGIDVDWEFPHSDEDATNFLALLTEFRQQMDALRPGLMLTIAAGPSPRMYAGADIAAAARLLDQVGLMTYDFTGPWNHQTGFIAPLQSVTVSPPTNDAVVAASVQAAVASAPHSGPSVARTVQAWIEAGVPHEKLLVGIPLYGYGWHEVANVANGVAQDGTPIRGDRPYSYISTLAAKSKLYRDPASQTPWLFDGDAFWTYDDPISVGAKAAFAGSQHLGGMMFWELSQDTAEAHLLHAAHNCLNSTPAPTPQPKEQPSAAIAFASTGNPAQATTAGVIPISGCQ